MRMLVHDSNGQIIEIEIEDELTITQEMLAGVKDFEPDSLRDNVEGFAIAVMQLERSLRATQKALGVVEVPISDDEV